MGRKESCCEYGRDLLLFGGGGKNIFFKIYSIVKLKIRTHLVRMDRVGVLLGQEFCLRDVDDKADDGDDDGICDELVCQTKVRMSDDETEGEREGTVA